MWCRLQHCGTGQGLRLAPIECNYVNGGQMLPLADCLVSSKASGLSDIQLDVTRARSRSRCGRCSTGTLSPGCPSETEFSVFSLSCRLGLLSQRRKS